MSSTSNSISIKSIYIDFKAITKAGLAISVVFSSIAGFLLGVSNFQSLHWIVLLKLAIGGYCMVGASNAYNQVIEKDLDALMDRTKNRPVASGRMTPNIALIVASILTVIGIVLLLTINPKASMFGASFYSKIMKKQVSLCCLQVKKIMELLCKYYYIQFG